MTWIADVATLEALYGQPGAAALKKVARRVTPTYRAWIGCARFCLVATVGPEGTDCSPRGDDGPVVMELDPGTLALPDWRGNNRMDTLRNIVADGRISLTFLVSGANTLVRVNGRARVSIDPQLIDRFDRSGTQPRSVIVIEIGEIYTQCARALMRADLWQRDVVDGLPTVGDILAEMTQGALDGAAYDAEWAGRAEKTLW